ncbi:hypothetical protein M3Y99_01924600 [Aphelenchoides fujianensis]|nr:hypothetical protein M3Y99_01924600 [Aphelenchoides fujianensis]
MQRPSRRSLKENSLRVPSFMSGIGVALAPPTVRRPRSSSKKRAESPVANMTTLRSTLTPMPRRSLSPRRCKMPPRPFVFDTPNGELKIDISKACAPDLPPERSLHAFLSRRPGALIDNRLLVLNYKKEIVEMAVEFLGGESFIASPKEALELLKLAREWELQELAASLFNHCQKLLARARK